MSGRRSYLQENYERCQKQRWLKGGSERNSVIYLLLEYGFVLCITLNFNLGFYYVYTI